MDQTPSLFILGSFVVACSAKVARLPQPGESLRADAFTVEAGGKGLNVALGAHRLGARVDGLFAIGNDLFSQLAPTAFAQAGLSPAMLRRYEATTGSGIGFTDAAGENCLAVHSGANDRLSARDVAAVAAAVRSADLTAAQFEIGDEPILEAFSIARAAGRLTLLNPSPYRSVDPCILERTSVLVVNRVEAARMIEDLSRVEAARVASEAKPTAPADHPAFEILPKDLAGMAHILQARGPDLVVVTLGRDGAMAFRQGQPPLVQPAFSVEAVDSLGAGDAFAAGLAVGLARGRPDPECLAWAAAAGAMVCRGVGVFGQLPWAADLERFLAEHGSSLAA